MTQTTLAAPSAPRLRRFGAVDAAAIARAEAALKSLSGQFGEWLDAEVVKLTAARAAVAAQRTTETADDLYLRAHDLKGLGSTYEHPSVTRVAGSLCRLLDGPRRMTAPLSLIDDHVDAIRTLVRDGLKDADGPVAGILAADLEARVAAEVDR